jgi:hypothetical protein
MGVTQKLGTIPLAILTDASNNVGIGAAPSGSYKLEVTGTAKVTTSLTVSSTANASLIAATNSTTGYAVLDLINNGASGKNYQIGVGGNAAASGYANNLYFDLVGVGTIMTLTSGRNVGIGTNSTGFNTAGLPLVVGSGSGNTGLTIFSGASSSGSIHFADTETTGDGSYAGFINYSHSTNSMQFGTTGPTPTERMRITSAGDILVGLTSSTYSTTNRTSIVASGTNTALFGLVTGGVNKGYFYSDGTNILLMSEAPSGFMSFGTNNTERMRITSGGDVTVGVTSPSYSSTNRGNITIGGSSDSILALQVNSVARAYLYSDINNTYIDNSAGAGDLIVLNGTGGVKLQRNATAWISNSDERLKNINSNIENALDKILTLRAVNFSWKSDDTNAENLGLIAQDIEKVFPQVVSKSKLVSSINEEQLDETEYLGVRYTELIPVLVKAIQELNERLNKAGL